MHAYNRKRIVLTTAVAVAGGGCAHSYVIALLDISAVYITGKHY